MVTGLCVFCALLQFMEGLSDRECERFLQKNTAAKWFVVFYSPVKHLITKVSVMHTTEL